ncbi:hypothetical protein WAE58_24810 [Pedobacter panaciterrae]|uniref:O-antigen ligase-like membrane protein n=1 Tax=Pedobacter panaciterrae TaxID=363849 RepID=A0ABU8NTU3_9SPHI
MLPLKKVQFDLPSLIVTLFLALEILSFFFLNKSFFDFAFIFIGLVIFATQFKYIVNYKIGMFMLFLITAGYSFFILYAFQGRITTIPLRLIMHFSLLILLIRYRINQLYIKILLYIFVAYTFFYTLVLGQTLRGMLAGGSENFVGWLALSLGVYYYLLCYVNKDKMKLQVAIVVLIAAISYLGRGTIGGAIILFAAVTFYLISSKPLKYKIFVFLVISLFSTVLLLSDTISEISNLAFRKFNEKGIDLDERDMILRDYIDRINLQTFFTGISPDHYPFTLHHGNFHNSYLLVHSQFGLIGAMFIGLILLTFLLKIWKSPFLCLLLLSISLRVFTDVIAYIGYIDFFIFYHLYIIWNNNYLKKRMKLNFVK